MAGKEFAMTGWQPIETVPEGKQVLIYNPTWRVIRMGTFCPDGWYVGDIMTQFVSVRDRRNVGVLWHPLPAKPE